MNYFNYFSEIEELFVRRRGRNLLLSPLDWALIESWQERAVPLHVILRGIESVFDVVDRQTGSNKRTVKSLVYCKEEIEAQYAAWLERQIGNNRVRIPDSKAQSQTVEVQNSEIEAPAAPRNALFSDDALISHLEKVSLEINSAAAAAAGDFQKTLTEISSRLAQLEKESHTAESLETVLEKLDTRLDAALLENFEIERLKSAVEKQIAGYKNKMEPEVYQRTFDLMLVKRLREQANVPRLSLFYL